MVERICASLMLHDVSPVKNSLNMRQGVVGSVIETSIPISACYFLSEISLPSVTLRVLMGGNMEHDFLLAH